MTETSGLHLTKIAFGCADFDDLRRRMEARAERGEPILLHTRYRPKREAEMEGASLYWISQHKFGLRQPILGFEEGENGHTLIRLSPEMIMVEPRPKRAHQGWRYLAGKDAPRDLTDLGGGEGIPAAMQAELAALGLL
ncbi:DUF1489 domain-containing protein [Sphingomonas crocodyli]|uniref:DUF1489 family protein n=1 Tax=Sphingomonas crocodyli TaxID=1979270 RepID=A0A437MA40_9SPHN|nr:DUF1489 domain-containing protein [Sphingomonas crocodyli]RVT94504.1 DUF1489 family protein [Sphingomonas crocodyli]